MLPRRGESVSKICNVKLAMVNSMLDFCLMFTLLGKDILYLRHCQLVVLMMLVHVLRSVSSMVVIVVVGVVVRGMRLAHPEVRRILYVVVVAVLLWWKVVEDLT